MANEFKGTIAYFSDVLALKEGRLADKSYAILPEFRKKKVDGYRFIKDKALSSGAWALFKHACNNIAIKDADSKVVIDEFGKPRFLGDEYYFNISHSDSVAVCVISDCQVGCDVQKITDVSFKVADKVFSEQEKEWLACHDKNEFFRLWALKESYLKAIGQGFMHNPMTVNIDLSDGSPKINDSPEWKFFEQKVDDYYFACCVKCDNACDMKFLKADISYVVNQA